MVDLRPVDAAAVGGVEAVALGQEMLERAGLGGERRTACAIGGAQRAREGARLGAHARVVDPVATRANAHVRAEIGQPVQAPRRLDRDAAAGVQAEEPDAGLLAVGHVGAHVQLGERRQPRHGQRAAKADAAHPERRKAEPGVAVIGLDGQLRRHEPPKRRIRNAPVSEQQVMPRLPHQPAPLRERPRAVGQLLERCGLPRRPTEQPGRHIRGQYRPSSQAVSRR